MLSILLDWLPGIVSAAGLVIAFFWGRERTKRKQAEATIRDLKRRDEIREDVRIDTDEALVDRLSRR